MSTSPASPSNVAAQSSDIPTLLRFLTRSCSVPLATALKAVPTLQTLKLTSTSALASSDVATLSPIFGEDAKLCRKIISAAKKEQAGTSSTVQKRKRDHFEDAEHPNGKDGRSSTDEDALALPTPITDLSALNPTILTSNRAPLLLALTLRLLKSTMPTQPLSSRLSLAQALVSANAKSKAVSIGLRSEVDQRKAAENELGRRKVRIMGREVAVMRRSTGDEDGDGEALWGLDVDAVENGKGQESQGLGSGLPIHTPQAARAYVLRAFSLVKHDDGDGGADDPVEEVQASTPRKSQKERKKSRAELRREDEEEKHRCLALLLGALDLLFESWDSLTREELDRRAWQWYLHIRPNVEAGPRGWGGKGEIALTKILELRK
ncbi:MAG: hypothetical protein M1828_000473 [Chrysothrix sp. TS-e1954]|nr:MAG: hypothetical protein M1828_000473 [Chrysothrix sp. TS-e1954]